MPCKFRLRTTRPDGQKEDMPLDDLLDESEKIKELEQQQVSDEVYDETSRTVEEVVVGTAPNTVTIERMTSVTFTEQTSGKTLTLNFDNPPA